VEENHAYRIVCPYEARPDCRIDPHAAAVRHQISCGTVGRAQGKEGQGMTDKWSPDKTSGKGKGKDGKSRTERRRGKGDK